MLKRFLFLDLESTLITPVTNGWHDFEIINQSKVKQLIKTLPPDTVNIFSFAIWNGVEREKFTTWTRSEIERLHNIKLEMVPAVDIEIKELCCRVRKIHTSKVEFSDMCDFWGKGGSFKLFAQAIGEQMSVRSDDVFEFVLLDDDVNHEVVALPEIRSVVKIINVDKIQSFPF